MIPRRVLAQAPPLRALSPVVWALLAVLRVLAPVVTLSPPAEADPPRIPGETAAAITITVARDGSGAGVVPGPFAVLPDGRVAIYIAESDGILVLEGNRILHHFPIPSDEHGLDDMAAAGTMLVAGRRIHGAGANVDLFVLDLATGRVIQRVQSANPYLRAPDEDPDRWRVVVEGDVVGAFEPLTAASYPLWDRNTGPIPGSEQVIRATSGLGLGASAAWIPQPDGSLARKVRGRAEPFSGADEGEFVGASPDGRVVLLQVDDPAATPRRLPRDLVVRVLEADHAISELRLAVSVEGETPERCVVSGPPVRVHGDRLYWVHLAYDELQIRTTTLPARTGG